MHGARACTRHSQFHTATQTTCTMNPSLLSIFLTITLLALGAPVADAYNCTCPNGTPTTGAGTTGCQADGVDCSACKAGFFIALKSDPYKNATAGNGSQTCTACTPVIQSSAGLTCTTTQNSQVTSCKDTHLLVQSANSALADTCKEKGAETFCKTPEHADCNVCCSTKSSHCVKKKCWKCWADKTSSNCKSCWDNKCMPECQVRVQLSTSLWNFTLTVMSCHVHAAMLQQRPRQPSPVALDALQPCRHLQCFRCRPTARGSCLRSGCPLMSEMRSHGWKNDLLANHSDRREPMLARVGRFTQRGV